mgnify:CR=1 FL=1
MPTSFKKNVDLAVEQGNYASLSEFFRDAVRALEDEQLVQNIMESEREFASGKGKKLKSLRDLM